MRHKFAWTILILGIFVFFWPLLFLNFSQDDFYCLLISKADSIKDFVNFFTPEHSFITSRYNFYRPLSTQFYFGVMQKIFGLNPMPFHFFNLFVHIINTFLVYKLASIFVNNKKMAILASFFYGLNQSLLISVGYISNVQILLATTFSFLTIIFYKKRLILSLIFFVLALLSKESAITIPLVLLLINYKRAFYFFLILIPYIYMHFVKFPFEVREYQMIVSPRVFNTLGWYLAWGLGLPEMFVDYVGPRLTIIPIFWKMFFKEGITIFSLFGILTLLATGGFINKIKRVPMILGIFYIILLLPVLFFPQNKFPFHGTTALGILAVILAAITASSRKIIGGAIMIVFLLLQFNSRQLTVRTHPLFTRSKIVESNITPFIKTYPSLPSGTVISVKNDPKYPYIAQSWGGTAKQLYFAASGANSFKIYYGESIKVYYEGVDKLPDEIETPNFIEITAKVPY